MVFSFQRKRERGRKGEKDGLCERLFFVFSLSPLIATPTTIGTTNQFEISFLTLGKNVSSVYLVVRRALDCRRRDFGENRGMSRKWKSLAKGRKQKRKDPAKNKKTPASSVLLRLYPPPPLPNTETSRSTPCRWQRSCAWTGRRTSGGGGRGGGPGFGKRWSFSPVGSTFFFLFRPGGWGGVEWRKLFLSASGVCLVWFWCSTKGRARSGRARKRDERPESERVESPRRVGYEKRGKRQRPLSLSLSLSLSLCSTALSRLLRSSSMSSVFSEDQCFFDLAGNTKLEGSAKAQRRRA